LQKFYHPTSHKIMSFISLSMFGSFLYFSNYQGAAYWVQSIFLFFIILSILYLYEMFSIVIVDDIGIKVVYLFQREKNAYWSQITDIRENDTMQRLDISSSSNQKLLHINQQLNGYISVIEIIENKLPNIYKNKINNIFHRKNYILIITTISAIFFGSLMIYFINKGDDPIMTLLLGIFPMIGLVGYFAEIRTIQIFEDSIHLIYPVRTKIIKKEDVTNITLDYESGGYGSKYSIVYIYLTKGKPIKIGGFKEDENVIFESLKSLLKLEGT